LPLRRTTAPRSRAQATLRGLTPGAAYSYRVGTAGDPFSWSPRFSFRAQRERDDSAAAQPFRLLALCDAGEVDASRAGAINAAATDAGQVRARARLRACACAHALSQRGLARRRRRTMRCCTAATWRTT
jgi:hypothetical protein